MVKASKFYVKVSVKLYHCFPKFDILTIYCLEMPKVLLNFINISGIYKPLPHGSSGPPSFTCLKKDNVKEVLSE